MDKKRSAQGNKKGPTRKTTRDGQRAGRSAQPRASRSAVLRDAEVRYRTLFESLDAAVLLMHGPVCVECNPATLTLFGLDSKDEIIGKTPLDFAPPKQPDGRNSAELVQRNVEQALAKGLHVFEWQAFRKSGQPVFMEVRFTPYRIDDEQYFQCIAIDITERKKAEAELLESERKYRFLVEATNTGFVILDTRGRVLDANDMYVRLSGHERQGDVLGRRVVEWTAEHDRDRNAQEVQKCLREGFVRGLEIDYIRKDGGFTPVEIDATVMGEGEAARIFSLCWDISSRRNAEATLRESEGRLRTVTVNAPDTILQVDRKGMITFVNRPVPGMTVADFVGTDVYRWVPQDNHEIVRNALEQAFTTGQRQEYESAGPGPGGEERFYSVRVMPVTGGERIESAIYIATDITAQKRAEQELAERNALLQQIMDTASVAIFLVDKQGHITHANERMAEMFACSMEELVGSEYVAHVHPSERDTGRKKMLALLASEIDAVDLERYYWRKDGTEFWGHLVGRRMHDESGNEMGLIGVITDIDTRKRAEEGLRESEEKYRLAMDATTDGLWDWDIASGTVYYSPTWQNILGLEQMVNEYGTWESRIHPDDKSAVLEGLEAHLAGTTIVWQKEHRLRAADKTWKWVLGRGRVVSRDTEGRPLRMVGTMTDISERKRAELALKDSEAKYRRLYNETPVMMHSIDRNAVVVDVNDQWLKVMGYERHEVIGRNVNDFYTPESAKYGREVVQPAFFRDGFVKDIAYQFVKKNGDVIDVLLSSIGERDASGRVVRSQSVIENVTERKRAADALQKSERMLQTIIDAEPECVKLLDKDANLLFMNRAGLDMIEADSLEQVKGKCVCPLVTSEYRQDFLDLAARVFSGQSGTLLFEITGLKGRRLWMETHAVPLRNDREEVVAFLGVTRDVTDRKRAVDALRASEERFRALAEALPLTIFEMDLQGRLLYVNNAALETFGYTQEDVAAGLSMAEVLAPEDRERALATMARRLTGDVSGYFEYRGLRKDGTTFPISVASTPIMEQGKPAGLRGIVSDLTQSRELEEERLKTQKLESIGTLAGGIAHDFNNLLQGVFGYLSMAKLTLDQRERSLAMLEQAERALHRSVGLTSQLLTFSKGGKPLKKAIDLPPVLEDAARFALSGSRVVHQMEVERDLPAVDADEGQISQVIQNIVLNADQAMPMGGVVVIAVRRSATHEGFVEVTIRDSGMGIAPEYLDRIFDPYFTTKDRGSGLGLATSYSIIKNHGGSIGVTSVLGKGTTFTILIPASQHRPERVEEGEAPAPGKRARILVMDDEEIVRSVADELLRSLGHEVDFAEHGASAIERYRAARESGRPYECVILDLTIRGGMGGLETLRHLREIDPAVIAIVSSGYSDDTAAANFSRQGFRAFLKKPYDLTGLRAVLHSVLPPE